MQFMNNKEFATKLEYRTRQFGISIINLSASLPSSIEGKVIRNQITKLGQVLAQITMKQIDLEVKETLKIKLKYQKVKQLKQSIG